MATKYMYSVMELLRLGQQLAKPRIAGNIFSRLRDFRITKPFRETRGGAKQQRSILPWIGQEYRSITH